MRVLPRVKTPLALAGGVYFFSAVAGGAGGRSPVALLHDVTPARVVVAEDGTPLWRFADAQGVWRYPVTLADVSPRYLQALIQYEDRWFWRHPGSILRGAARRLAGSYFRASYLGGSTLTMQVAPPADPHPRTLGGEAAPAVASAAA